MLEKPSWREALKDSVIIRDDHGIWEKLKLIRGVPGERIELGMIVVCGRSRPLLSLSRFQPFLFKYVVLAFSLLRSHQQSIA